MKALPASLIGSLKAVPGFDEESFVAAHKEPAVTSVRLHPGRRATLAWNTTPVPWCASGRYLEQRPVFTLDPLFHAGTYYVQEASSMLLDHLFRTIHSDRKDMRVLDLCAAPGGKSTLIAAALDEGSLLISNEVIRTRASILEENVSRWGIMNNWVVSNDPSSFNKLHGYFDAMVIDAPCSGSGLFRKDAAALDEWSEANVQLCSERQQRIIADVWPSLKEDGVLYYATCSYSAEEDEQILDWLGDHFSVESIYAELPEEWGIVTTVSPRHKLNGYRFFPGKVKGEGFFIAAIRKKDPCEKLKPSRFKSLHDKNAWNQSSFLLNRKDIACIKHGDVFIAIDEQHQEDFQLLQQFVFIRKAGLELGSPTAKEWLPAHDIALSIDRSGALSSVDVTKEQALLFLKKEEMHLPPMDKGWYLVCYEGHALGWIKSIGNRYNNYLPKHWRIRMSIDDADWK